LKFLRVIFFAIFLLPLTVWAHGADGGSFKAKNFWLGWMTLSKANKESLPVDWILQLSADTNRIRPKKIPFPAWQVKELEEQVGTLEEHERQLIAYEIKKDGPLRPKKHFGYIVFFHVVRSSGELEMAVHMNEAGELLSIQPVTYPTGEQPLDASFWAQFSKKTIKDPWQAGQDVKAPEGKEEIASAIFTASKRALLLSRTALRFE
jgi:hypothetical protein